uniref:C3H1-type domain-containing protein n=1 Tax=Zooxanthella nutricula TaxID=1333877 RepID=A0A7S2QN32_9DINO
MSKGTAATGSRSPRSSVPGSSAQTSSVPTSSSAQESARGHGLAMYSEAASASGPDSTEGLPPLSLDLLTSVPYNEDGLMTSVGSIDHFSGRCRPCAYWFKGVCGRGIACQRCHFVHQGQKGKRLRPSKQMRDRLRRQGWDESTSEASETVAEDSSRISGGSHSGSSQPSGPSSSFPLAGSHSGGSHPSSANPLVAKGPRRNSVPL